jgi:hypothetical protein
MTLTIMKLSTNTLGVMTLSIMIFCMIALSIKH